MTNIKNLFICVLSIYISSLEKSLIKSFAHFLTIFNSFFAIDLYAFLYILDVNPLSNVQFANISPIGCKYFLLFCRLPLYYIL